MSINAMVACRRVQTGSPTLKAVLMAMADVANDDGENIYVSTSTVATHTEFSRRSVINAIDRLVELGAILVVEVRYGTTTLYKISPQIMSGETLDLCRRCTSAGGALVQEMHGGSAGDARVGVQEVHRGGAGGAPKHNINSSINSNLTQTRERSSASAQPVKRFVKPTVEEVMAYMVEIGYPRPSESCHEFVDFYESKGWMVGKSKMKEWKPAVRLWLGKRKKENPKAFADAKKFEAIESNDPIEGVDFIYGQNGEKLKPSGKRPFDEQAWREIRNVNIGRQ